MPSKLPPELTPELRTRRRDLAAQATGRTLDLGGWDDHVDAYRDDADVTRLDRLENLDGVVGEFDTIISMIRTPLVADFDGFIADLISHLGPEGRVLLLEPTVRFGRAGQLLALGGRLSKPVIGLHLDRDIPARIRRVGLFVTDLHRFEVASVSAPFRPFVEAHCRRPTRQAVSDVEADLS